MSLVLVASSVVPFMREPNPRSEVVTQAVIGELAQVGEQRGDWYAVRREVDGYSGWAHRGHLRPVSDDEASRWRGGATGRADGATLRDDAGRPFTLPLMGRALSSGERWELPAGWSGRLEAGAMLMTEEMARQARSQRAVDWAISRFNGAAYFWGGITPWGVDCSGLIQTTYLARGIPLPRDSKDQATCGLPVPPTAIEPNDLLFFSDGGDKITHVAFAGDDESLVHSTIACGGFVIESWRPGHRASRLRELLVAVRRIPEPA